MRCRGENKGGTSCTECDGRREGSGRAARLPRRGPKSEGPVPSASSTKPACPREGRQRFRARSPKDDGEARRSLESSESKDHRVRSDSRQAMPHENKREGGQ